MALPSRQTLVFTGLHDRGQELGTNDIVTANNTAKVCKPQQHCIHGRLPINCFECGGDSISEHQSHKKLRVQYMGPDICQAEKDKVQEAESEKNTKKRKYKNPRCEHNRRKSYCIDCGGGSICPHQRVRSSCKDCGTSFCEHGRQKSKCKHCSGASICEHNRHRTYCKDCGGGSICIHQRTKSKCKKCNGGSVCQHNRVRYNCRECGGGSICIHERLKTRCKECGGKTLCVHNRERTKCKECGGGSFCKHMRQKSKCKECGGVGLCVHNRVKSLCFECGGNRICEHNRERCRCQECPRCVICKTSTAAHGDKTDMCLGCYRLAAVASARPREAELQRYLENKKKIQIRRDMMPRKKDEMALKTFLNEMPGLEVVIHDKTVVGADRECEGANKRPDFQLGVRKIQEHMSIWVECDENQHNSPQYGCELKRIWNMYAAMVYKKSVHVIRWNPHAFKTGFKLSSEAVKKHERYELLTKEINHSIEEAERGPLAYTLKITWICFNCKCGSMAQCGYVHSEVFKTEQEVQQAIDSQSQ